MIFMIVLVALLVGVNVYSLRRLADARNELRHFSQRSLPDPRDGDEAMLSYVEACATVSPLAERLLREAQAPRALQAAENVATEPDWMHDPDKHVPCNVQWELTLQDVTSEASQEARLDALRCWVANDYRFTAVERNELVKLFKGKHRLQARRLLFNGRKRT